MAKNRKTPDMNLPVWFDGQNINEALFCEEFLQERRIIFNETRTSEVEQETFRWAEKELGYI